MFWKLFGHEKDIYEFLITSRIPRFYSSLKNSKVGSSLDKTRKFADNVSGTVIVKCSVLSDK